MKTDLKGLALLAGMLLLFSSQAHALRACGSLIREGDSRVVIEILARRCKSIEIVASEYMGYGRYRISLMQDNRRIYPLIFKNGTLVNIKRHQRLRRI
ncbi:MAG TPA: hypothetical protein EYQ26_04520 [Rhodospirillales bacterium]|nr:hypothetical protein [Rhodospirillales bacterium]HIL75869.1 hypothetical protein [Rhodospirillales bacterium]